jgi:hypothetical protein
MRRSPVAESFHQSSPHDNNLTLLGVADVGTSSTLPHILDTLRGWMRLAPTLGASRLAQPKKQKNHHQFASQLAFICARKK